MLWFFRLSCFFSFGRVWFQCSFHAFVISQLVKWKRLLRDRLATQYPVKCANQIFFINLLSYWSSRFCCCSRRVAHDLSVKVLESVLLLFRLWLRLRGCSYRPWWMRCLKVESHPILRIYPCITWHCQSYFFFLTNIFLYPLSISEELSFIIFWSLSRTQKCIHFSHTWEKEWKLESIFISLH